MLFDLVVLKDNLSLISSVDEFKMYFEEVSLRSRSRVLKLMVLMHFVLLGRVLSMKIYFHFSNAQCDR
jgi:hypothetical protein